MGMNIREGVRRLGILLGASGAILGGSLAFKDAQTLWNTRTAHRNFEAVMASSTMQRIAKAAREQKESGGFAALVNVDGIKQVEVDRAGVVSSIELSTGESVHRTEAPALKAYVSLLLYPMLGFLAPWGTIRVLTWVGSGFFTSAR